MARKLLGLVFLILVPWATADEACIDKAVHSEVVRRADDLATKLQHVQTSCDADKNAAESVRRDLEQRLDAALQQKKTCHDGTENLFKRLETCENDVKSMSATATKQDAALQECKKKVSAMNEQSSEALASCHREVTELRSLEGKLSSCQADLKSTGDSLLSVKNTLQAKAKNFVEDLGNLKALLEKGEAQRKEALATSAARGELVEKLQKELHRAETMLKDVADSKLLMSAEQLKQTTRKVIVFSTILAKFIANKAAAAIPPFVYEEMQRLQQQALVQGEGLYQNVRPYVETTRAVLVQNALTARKLYQDVVAPRISEGLEKAQASEHVRRVMHITQENARDVLNKGDQWVNINLVVPLTTAWPEVRELIPESSFDRLVVLLYLLCILYATAVLLRFFIRTCLYPILRLSRTLLFLPFTLLGWCFRRSSTSLNLNVKSAEKRSKKSNDKKPSDKKYIDDSSSTRKNEKVTPSRAKKAA